MDFFYFKDKADANMKFVQCFLFFVYMKQVKSSIFQNIEHACTPQISIKNRRIHAKSQFNRR